VALDLARAGNFPSVASNVLAALVLSAGGAWPAPREFALALLAGLLAGGRSEAQLVADACRRGEWVASRAGACPDGPGPEQES
jgi:hypothetical protein